MENMPPNSSSSSSFSSRRRPPMHKSSPARRPALAPHSENDVFSVGVTLHSSSTDPEKSLISPPPEEDAVFRPTSRQPPSSRGRAGSEPATSRGSLAKRKRSALATVTTVDDDDTERSYPGPDATPNPRLRKQTRRARVDVDSDHEHDAAAHSPTTKRHSPTTTRAHRSPAPAPAASPSKRLLNSPHASKHAADYIPPIPAHTRAHTSARARSSTPIGVYEPPAERFTPPREITIASPQQRKSSPRKSRVSRLKLVVKVKEELPEIDLSKPAPPPSPTDDPLLLRGRLRRAKATASLASSTPPGPSTSRVSPPSRTGADISFSRTGGALASSSQSPTPIFLQDGTLPPSSPDDAVFSPMFDFNGATAADDWNSDGDDDLDVEEGEYTGKFRMTSVPTKMDPPTSRTRDRIESWGRPISPFPLKLKGKGKEKAIEEEEEEEQRDVPMVSDEEDIQESEETVREEFAPDASFTNVPDRDAMEGVERSPSPHETRGDLDDLLDFSNSTADRLSPQPEEHLPSQPQLPTPSPNQEVVRALSPPLPVRVRHASEDVQRPQRSPRKLQRHAPGTDSGFVEGSAFFEDPKVPESVEGHQQTPQQESTSLVDQGEITEEVVEDQVPEIRVRAPSLPRAQSVEEEEEEEQVYIDRQLSVDPQPGPSTFSRREVIEIPEEDEQMGDPDAEVDDDSDGDSSDEADLNVVKVVSDDPWAAARAAAILKQHAQWDLISKAPRRRQSSVEGLIRHARRADLAGAGVRKSSSPRSTPARALPAHLAREFRTPSPFTHRSSSEPSAPVVIDTEGPRMWTKDDWKLLDACFTDERLELGERYGHGVLGDVDLVDLEDVADRFIQLFGGFEVILGLGDSWSRDDLLTRSKALQKKQRSGEVAPPTPSLRASSTSSSTPTVPDFTPIHTLRRQGLPPATAPKLSAPSFSDASSKMPAPLMNPRYSHLMAEAVTVHRADVSKSDDQSAAAGAAGSASSSSGRLPVWGTSEASPPPSPSVGSRMKGLFFSYLPTLKSKSKPAPKAFEPAHPGLPLPPPEVLEKPRGPVMTPEPKPLPKPAPPKDLVNLAHAPLPESKLPVVRARTPRRLVDLRPVTPVAEERERERQARRSSGGSVKDLVSSFEEIDRSRRIEAQALALRRQKSMSRIGGGGGASAKPAWR